MQFSESWLRKYIDLRLNSQELSNALTMSGLEVEKIIPFVSSYEKIVVAKILNIQISPNDQYAYLCDVKVHENKVLKIICKNKNIKSGMKVVCAFIEIPIKKKEKNSIIQKIKKESQGILCSEYILGIGQKKNIMELPNDAPIGKDIKEYLKLGNDVIFFTKPTPNKTDCLSIYGIAREISIITGEKLKEIEISPVVNNLLDHLSIKIKNKELCGRFTGRIIKNVNTKEKTPFWIKRYLESAGQKSTSVLYDIANYVMLTFGHPFHIFDLDKLSKQIIIRFAKNNEVLKFSNKIIHLQKDIGIIADNNGPKSLAGIADSDEVMITSNTKNIYIACAFWKPESVRKYARKLNFLTESSYRFERGVDPYQTIRSIELFSQLASEICGGQFSAIDDYILDLPEKKTIYLRINRLRKITGVPFSIEQVENFFLRSNFIFKKTESPEIVFTVQPPVYRFDIQIEEDLIAEVIRLHGFDNIPIEIPKYFQNSLYVNSDAEYSIHKIRHAFAEKDYHEVLNFSFIEEEIEKNIHCNTNLIKLANPITSNLSVMRSSLIGGLIKNLEQNIVRQINRVRLFEVGHIFLKNKNIVKDSFSVSGYEQLMKIAGLTFGSAYPLQWGLSNRAVDFYDVKGEIDSIFKPFVLEYKHIKHPVLQFGCSAEISCNIRNKNILIGILGELHPKWKQLYNLQNGVILFELDWKAIQEVYSFISSSKKLIKPVTKFPVAIRDLSIIVKKDISFSELYIIMKKRNQKLIQSIQLFDCFIPDVGTYDISENEKSLTFRIVLSSKTRTLKEQEINHIMRDLLSVINKKYNVKLRCIKNQE